VADLLAAVDVIPPGDLLAAILSALNFIFTHEFSSQHTQLHSMMFYLLQMLFLYFDRLSLFSRTCPYRLSLRGLDTPSSEYIFFLTLYAISSERCEVLDSAYFIQNMVLLSEHKQQSAVLLLTVTLSFVETGVDIQTQTPQPSPTLVTPVTLPATNNNFKKFAFLAQETVPDYRPRDVSYSLMMDIRNFFLLFARNQTVI
jgi:hypothetical protein